MSGLPLVEEVARKLGGAKMLGREVHSDADLARVVADGTSPLLITFVLDSGFERDEIYEFVIPARTLRHRIKKNQPLTEDESDRLVRLTRIQTIAEDVFGNKEKANRWLRERLGILDGKTPLEMARTEAGGRVIEQILAKIDWGAAA